MAFEWVGEVLLGDPRPIILDEIGFLRRGTAVNDREGVGRIDNILVARDQTYGLNWCALEKQAVYFSGANRLDDFQAIVSHEAEGIPFPHGSRRPDYRSNGVKRLMPQLLIKVPTLTEWGKKMAVVTDQDFFASINPPMEEVGQADEWEVAWFVCEYDESGGEAILRRGSIHFTTLEGTVKGLTAAVPVDLPTFDNNIRERIRRLNT